MSDIVPEIGQGRADAGDVPVPVTSPDVPAANPSTQSGADEVVEKVWKRLQPELRKLQSEKDKRYTKLEGAANELLAFRDHLKAAGFDAAKVDAVTRDYQLDKMLEQPTSSPEPAGPGPQVDTRAEMQRWTADYLNEAGVDFEDLEYKALVKTGAKDLPDWQNKVTRFVARQRKQAVTPGAASAVASGTGGVAVTGGNEAKLSAKYAELRELQQAPPTLQTRKALKDVSDEIVKLGGHA